MKPSRSHAFVSEQPLPLWLYPVAALAYFATFRLGLWSTHAGEVIAPLWLATGLGIWLVARFGSRIIVAVALGELAANWLAGEPVKGVTAAVVLTVIISGNVLTALFGAWLWRSARERWHDSLGDFCDPISGLLAAFVAPIVSATLGVGALYFGGRELPSMPVEMGLGWWTANAIGALFFLPLLFAAPKLWLQLRSAGARDLVRGALLLALSVGAAWLIFGQPGGGMYLFALLPGLLVATAWFGAPGALLLAFALFATGMIAGSQGHGSFVSGHLPDRALNLRLFLSALALVALLLPVFHARRNLLGRLPLALLFGGWGVGGLLFAQMQRQQERADASDFAQLTAKVQDRIQHRLSVCVEVMRSATGFIHASHSVERDEWQLFVVSLDLPQRLPGVRGLGLVNAVQPGDAAKFLTAVRADGAPAFSLHPVPGGTSAPDRAQYVLTFLAPSTDADSVLGLDLGSDPMRRRAIENARDTGEPCMTEQVAILQDDQRRSGFLLFLPVYQKGAPVATVAERRAALQSWIEVPFFTDAFFAGVLGDQATQLNLHVFEGTQADTAHLVFGSDPNRGSLPEFAQVTTFTSAGKNLFLGWSHGPAFGLSSRILLIWFAVSCALGALLLVGWMQSLQTFRDRAEALVVERTAKLAASEQSLAITLNSIGDAVIATDATGGITRMNPTAERLTGWLLADAAGRPLTEVFHIISAETRLRSVDPVQRVMATGEVVGLANHTALLARDGREYQIADSAAPIRAASQEIVGVVLVFSDVTEKYRADAALRLSDLALKSISQGVIIAAPDARILSVNAASVVISGYSETEIVGRGFELFQGPLSDPVTVAAIRAAVLAQVEFAGEILHYRKDGTANWNELTISPVCDARGVVSHFIGVTQDISIRKQAEAALHSSLQEKTALLKEVHHRVKNNLQIITSLLRMENGRCAQPDTKAVLTEMQGRIRSMALLHDSLYHSGTFAAVDLGQYLRQLSTELVRALVVKPGSIGLVQELAACPVEMDQALPCGMLVAELVSNCLKHGFRDGRSGEVRISWQPVADQSRWRLGVSDNGMGLPADFESRRGQSLGLQLASDFAKKLGGTLEIGPGPATEFSVTFTVKSVLLPPHSRSSEQAAAV